MGSFPWQVIGPALSVLGMGVGLAFGYGIMKATVKDLQVEVLKLSSLATVVTGLQVDTTNVKAMVAAHGTELAKMRELVHAIDLKVAVLQRPVASQR